MLRKNNNLLIISTELEKTFDAITKNLLPNTDVIFMQKNKIIESLEIGLGNTLWNNIGIMLHGYKDEENNVISIFNLKICCEPYLSDIDYGAIQLIQLFGLLRKHCDGALHIFACNVGSSNGFKYLVAKADEKFKFHQGISVSTDIIGNNPDGSSDWKLDWNTIQGFADDATVPEIRQYLASTTDIDLILGTFLETVANIILSVLNYLQTKGTSKYPMITALPKLSYNAAYNSQIPVSLTNPFFNPDRKIALFNLCPTLVYNTYIYNDNSVVDKSYLIDFDILYSGAYVQNTVLYTVMKNKISNEVFFVFRGTGNASDVATDLFNTLDEINSLSLTSDVNVRINDGLQNAYVRLNTASSYNIIPINTVINTIRESKPSRIVFTGHSLGAGFAVLSAAFMLKNLTDNNQKIPVEICVFSALKVGNISFNKMMSNNLIKNNGVNSFYSFRIFEDIVPKLSLDMSLSNANLIPTSDKKFMFTGPVTSNPLTNKTIWGKTGFFIKSDLEVPFCNESCVNLAIQNVDKSTSENIFDFDGSLNGFYLAKLNYGNLVINHSINQFLPAKISDKTGSVVWENPNTKPTYDSFLQAIPKSVLTCL